MTAFISRLREAVEREAAAATAENAIEIDDARERLTPLKVRLDRLLTTIPLEVQREGLSLTTVQTMLRGRWRGHAHPGEVGAALRAAGFIRQRRWSDDDGFRAVWSLREQHK